MSSKSITPPVTIAACLAFGVSVAGVAIADPAANPFAMAPVSGGQPMLAEGKCGMKRMDANGDGKVTKEEFMQGHETMFDSMDANGNGVIDADERRGQQMHGKCRMQQDG
jgi:hypothetical protein